MGFLALVAGLKPVKAGDEYQNHTGTKRCIKIEQPSAFP